MHEQPDPQRDPGFDVPGALVEIFAEGGDGDPALRKHRGGLGPGLGGTGTPRNRPNPHPPRTCPSTGPSGGPGAAPPAGMRIRTGLGAAPEREAAAARTERAERAARDMAAAP